MIDTLSGLIQGGQIKLYATESNVAETLNDKNSDIADRMDRFAAFENYVINDLVPEIKADCRLPNTRIAVTGTSLGAYFAAIFALKHPEIFDFAFCMSGRYALTQFFGGHRSEAISFNNPLAFLPDLEGSNLERVRSLTHLTLVCGQGPFEEGCIEETQALGWLLHSKQISHYVDIWGHDVGHEWTWWRRQALMHLENLHV